MIYAKTQVAPPTNISPIDQYSQNLEAYYEQTASPEDFTQGRENWMAFGDRLRRFSKENVIDDALADEYRVKIDGRYGEDLIAYGFATFHDSTWPEQRLSNVDLLLRELEGDKLSNGQPAVDSEFTTKAAEIRRVISDYRSAWAIANSGGYRSISDSQSRLSQARTYMSAPFLQNNTALVTALGNLPKKIADAHYAYVAGQVSRLSNYSLDETSYDNLTASVDKVIKEYRNASCYGNQKRSIEDVAARANALVQGYYLQ